MLRNKKKYLLLVAIVAIALVFFAHKERTLEGEKGVSHTEEVLKVPDTKKEIPLKKDELSYAKGETPSEVIFFGASNVESMADECFQGAICEVEGDPWEQYLILKKENKRQVTDLYIALLRRKLSDSKFKDQYKDVLKRMIEDFYPASQIDFQMAAYYNYLGELELSLQKYLELEKKSKREPKLFQAPKLNIANTYYDLKRWSEALRYYKASLDDVKSTESNDSLESIHFINERIEIIRGKLRHE